MKIQYGISRLFDYFIVGVIIVNIVTLFLGTFDQLSKYEPVFNVIEQLTALGFDKLPVCVAKTQYSFSDDPTKLGAPEDFTVTVKNVKVSAGAGFIVALTGDILTMPGLPKVPAAEKIDVDENGRISGLF